ncbi:hypothetical protein [Spiroplasma floricola]|uniref:Uncharacterized protein n=1 Tax=Spiroplasma floricola 23-6 TaxID=1336749 RepID=A0A2K8SEP0_9MOLU|nr:hypothetical protein [Spiroplasma floricola]AUB31892.1 hypothetical protein SFLOR_v1c08440 [Spiroplasma floricola 23-6]
MKINIFFSVFSWVTASVLSFLGFFLIGEQFGIFVSTSELSLLRSLQITSILLIILLFIFGILEVSIKKGVIIPILYTIPAIVLAILNIVFLVNLMQKFTSLSLQISIVSYFLKNIITLSISSLLLLTSIVPIFLLSKKTDKNIKEKDNILSKKSLNDLSSITSSENSKKSPEFNPEFTSTPNEKTFNMVDKLAKLKEDINNNKFHEEELIEEKNIPLEKDFFDDNSLENVPLENNAYENNSLDVEFLDNNPIFKVEKPILKEDKYEEFENNSIKKATNKAMKNVAPVNDIPKLEELPPILEPKDPYKQTIVPRRSAQRAGEFDQPIGNVVKPTYVQRNIRKTAKLDENYQGKVFLGDSDRIWEAMKKQNRKLTPKKLKTDQGLSKSSTVNNLSRGKTKTMEINMDNILDPVNNKKDDQFTPTIDWDE